MTVKQPTHKSQITRKRSYIPKLHPAVWTATIISILCGGATVLSQPVAYGALKQTIVDQSTKINDLEKNKASAESVADIKETVKSIDERTIRIEQILMRNRH